MSSLKFTLLLLSLIWQIKTNTMVDETEKEIDEFTIIYHDLQQTKSQPIPTKKFKANKISTNIPCHIYILRLKKNNSLAGYLYEFEPGKTEERFVTVIFSNDPGLTNADLQIVLPDSQVIDFDIFISKINQ